VLRTFAGHSKDVTSVCFSPDGSRLLSGSIDETMKLWDVHSGACLRTIKEGLDNCVSSVRFSADGRYILAGANETTIWDVQSGRKLHGFHSDVYVEAACFTLDGGRVLSGTSDGIISLWDLQSGAKTRELIGHSGMINDLALFPDGKRFVSVASDGTLRCWDIQSGALVYSTIISPSGKQLLWTPEGFFSGDEELAQNAVYIQDGANRIDIGQFYDALYRPDLVAAKIAGEDISENASKINFQALLHGGLPPEVSFLTPSGPSDKREISLKMCIADLGGGVGKIIVAIDGMPVTIGDGSRGLKVSKAQGKGASASYDFEALVTLRDGDNRIELSAYNSTNTIESLKEAITLSFKESSAAKPNLHVLAVAVDKYRDKSLWLNYSVPDAESLVGLLGREDKLYGKATVYKLYDSQVTRELFAKKFDEIRSSVGPDDVFVLYLAGHGVTNPEDGDYYYLPSDFRYTDSSDVAKQGISKASILDNLSKIRAQKTILFFDTCNSGSFIDKPTSRGISEKTAIDRLKKAIGRAIIVASSDNQVALEGIEGHGVFTYTLLKGLSGAADPDKKGVVTISGLCSFIEGAVPDITYKKWGYEQVPMKELPRSDFPITSK
jgi:hypothetical protein